MQAGQRPGKIGDPGKREGIEGDGGHVVLESSE
jgi:hypothetical protein